MKAKTMLSITRQFVAKERGRCYGRYPGTEYAYADDDKIMATNEYIFCVLKNTDGLEEDRYYDPKTGLPWATPSTEPKFPPVAEYLNSPGQTSIGQFNKDAVKTIYDMTKTFDVIKFGDIAHVGSKFLGKVLRAVLAIMAQDQTAEISYAPTGCGVVIIRCLLGSFGIAAKDGAYEYETISTVVLDDIALPADKESLTVVA